MVIHLEPRPMVAELHQLVLVETVRLTQAVAVELVPLAVVAVVMVALA